ncbi:shikimate kinase [Flavobacterium johnsoniae]|uniref:Shikimate kinase n=1 Tax=Flavobacterium johnsoniae (strain ATCC 17061 / DSM 2064 / JCM 8514 / BCRC 14874 / CCUG 350202 / NBRC 14942 / NCIMB 11054 / UW101) TaxID=376686 RepID=AROK_FLAJ1|nr:shikimate kinase [Flavobacterium johnsoniae]A5FNY2.1 RecName: Full=Shikimate kinase; Short=SK [Flavobacterium johnsoniae UW101]ABQ03091.1 shikimate kinase [Flavobacterium johnsoniae UW101]OXG01472.1 shikimate kinase [Flavobacterium johnsoniae UW101]WQG80046.1 shikimate kinase [Flavobacterium johnsoniae UW101]SHL85492.1 shikimate kinase [Flavobacterium johnsoniae]
MEKIVLLGYMGCGKSTIAQNLSKITQIPFLDLDICIEKRANLSIKEIFEQHGEIYFRKLEHEMFLELLQSSENAIIGLGGGTPCYANNHLLLQRDDIVSVYLKASIDTLYNRLVHNKSKRPLIANMDEEEMKEFIAKHLFDRSFYYNHAQHKVAVDNRTIDETVQDILDILA